MNRIALPLSIITVSLLAACAAGPNSPAGPTASKGPVAQQMPYYAGNGVVQSVTNAPSMASAGGTVTTTITAGNVLLAIPSRSWRGAGADIRLATGVLNVELPPGFSGDIDVDILRSGKVVNTYEGLLAREKPGITERTVRARAGAGGAYFKFTVGDGTVNIRRSGDK